MGFRRYVVVNKYTYTCDFDLDEKRESERLSVKRLLVQCVRELVTFSVHVVNMNIAILYIGRASEQIRRSKKMKRVKKKKLSEQSS